MTIMLKLFFVPIAIVTLVFGQAVRAAEPGTETGHLTIEHYFELASVSDPQISPDGDWIAYAVSRQDLEEDTWKSRVWMVPATGGEPVAMTTEEEYSALYLTSHSI